LPREEEGGSVLSHEAREGYIEVAFAPGFNENEMEPKRAAFSTSLF
jgi:hypothetical protein